MKIVTIYKDSHTSETTHNGCNACIAAKEVKRILSDTNVEKIIIEVN